MRVIRKDENALEELSLNCLENLETTMNTWNRKNTVIPNSNTTTKKSQALFQEGAKPYSYEGVTSYLENDCGIHGIAVKNVLEKIRKRKEGLK